MYELKRSLAVVIGIDKYINGILPLQNAVNDAKQLANLLKKKYQYEVLLLLDSDATRSRLNDLLTAFKQRILLFPDGKEVKVESDDRLLFYFAGHGEAPDLLDASEGPAGYLIPQDGQQSDRNTWLPMLRLHNDLIELPCRHLLIVLDCCNAGTFRWATRKREARRSEQLYQERYDRYTSGYAMQVITSAAHDEKAADSSARFGQFDREILGHSPFAELLFQGLNGDADITKDGVITATELYIYLDGELPKKNPKQTPGLCDFGRHDKGQYIFPLPNFNRALLPTTPILTEKTNPYKGLESFEVGDSNNFFGRKALTENLVSFVEEHTLTIVVGASGLGKSSLVKAGLIPNFKNQNTCCILPPVRLEKSPFYALNDALERAGFPVLQMACQLNNGYLSENVNNIQWYKQFWENLSKNFNVWIENHPDCKLLLVIDQFEELFTGNSDEQEQEMFLKGLAKAVEEFPNSLRVVVTLRDDFEYRFSNTALAPFWEVAKFDLLSKTTITREELREIIIEPALAKAIDFEPLSLVDKLIDEVIQMPGGLPLLSFTLSELYFKYIKDVSEGKRSNRVITEDDYKELGGVVKSLTNRANKEYNELVQGDNTNAYAKTIRNVMLRMVAIGGTELARRQVLDSELVYPEPEENERVKQVIERFRKARLLVRGRDINGNIYTEPAHDILVRQWPKLQEWKHENEAKLILQRQLTDAAEEWKSQEEPIYSGFQEKVEVLVYWYDHTLEFFENFANKVISKLVRLWWEKPDKRKDYQKKREEFLWDTNPRLDLLEEQLDSQDNWFNQVEAEFVQYSVKRKHRNRRRFWNGAIALLTTFSVLSIGAAIYYKESENAYREAQIAKIGAYRQASEADLTANEDFDALINSLRAGKFLQDPRFQLLKSNSELQNQVKLTLQKAVYTAKERNRLRGHSNDVTSIIASFSPTGDLLVSAGDDGTICLWDLQGKLLKTWKEEQSQILSISFSSDGQQFATAGQEGTVRVWNVQGNLLKEWNPRLGWIRSINFSPKSQLLAIGGLNGTLLWNIENGQSRKLPEPENNWIWSVSFSPDGQQLATAGADGIARLWDLQGKLLKEFLQQRDKLRSVSFSPNGKLLATAGESDPVRLWGLQDNKLKELPQSAWNVNFSPDGQRLATAGKDGSIQLWDLQGGLLLELAKKREPMSTVSFNPKNQLLATAGDNDTVNLWDLQGKQLAELKAEQDKVHSISFSSNGQLLATTMDDGTVRWWNLQGQAIKDAKEDVPSKDSCNLKDKKLRVVIGEQGTMAADNAFLFGLRGNKLAETPKGHPNGLLSISCTVDGKLLATVGGDGKVRLWDLQHQPVKTQDKQFLNLVNEWSGEQDIIEFVQFSRDGNQLATGAKGSIYLWNLQGELLATWKTDQDWIRSISFSPDGKLLATAGYSGNPKLWRIESSDELIQRGCNWVKDYLNHSNVNLSREDRKLCDGMGNSQR